MLTLHVEGKNFEELVENACKVLGFRFDGSAPVEVKAQEEKPAPPKKRGRPAKSEKAKTTSVAPPAAQAPPVAPATPPSATSDVEVMKTELHKLFDPRPSDKGPQGKFRVLGILKKFEYAKTSDIKPEHYAEITRLAKAENDAYKAQAGQAKSATSL